MLIFVLKDWRNGIYCFFVWLVFEDLIRKFAGNGFAVFFAKDIIIGLTYLSMLVALRDRRLPTFKSPFFVALGIFFAFGLVQAFNVNSPGSPLQRPRFEGLFLLCAHDVCRLRDAAHRSRSAQNSDGKYLDRVNRIGHRGSSVHPGPDVF